jgi:hypothetical protein
LQGAERIASDLMPVVFVPGIVIGLVDKQVYTIGIAASDQSERGAVIAMVA